jgi:hypothetical protein
MKKIYIPLLGAAILLTSCQTEDHKSQGRPPSENQDQEQAPDDSSGKRNE